MGDTYPLHIRYRGAQLRDCRAGGHHHLECFGAAAAEVGLSDATPFSFQGFTFSCVYNNGFLMYGDGSAGSDGDSNQQFLCIGTYVVQTTTETTSTTATTTESSSTAITSTSTEGDDLPTRFSTRGTRATTSASATSRAPRSALASR
ncbi:unnamed protein product [Prorocentrum cordatum]|uniref:Uncharacterized protein n=1 Tax=Prorocentrum cordatum TaxID=2364126 RepID=A0ABN9UR48_9DINO|nr:unnamed protein product [Polarella glacialis]